MAREIHDHYFHEAKREGYRSRAAYKLLEIDDRRRILSPGDLVLDCGAAPGSWLQVAGRRIGPSGRGGIAIGIDLQPIEPNFAEDNIRTVQDDLRTVAAADLRRLAAPRDTADEDLPYFDVVLSDLAPGTTGDPRRDAFRSVDLGHALLDRCPDLLRGGGHLVMKVFEGEAYPELLERGRALFQRFKGYKPKASRSASVEMYLIGQGYNRRAAEADRQARTTPRKSKPTGDWGA